MYVKKKILGTFPFMSKIYNADATILKLVKLELIQSDATKKKLV